MVDRRSFWPLGLIRRLDFILRGHTFMISVVVLLLDALRAYPMLLGRPWLRTANIKQYWQCNMTTFWRGKTKLCVVTEEQVATPKDTTPLYA